jgi:hypothetical protein
MIWLGKYTIKYYQLPRDCELSLVRIFGPSTKKGLALLQFAISKLLKACWLSLSMDIPRIRSTRSRLPFSSQRKVVSWRMCNNQLFSLILWHTLYQIHVYHMKIICTIHFN